MEEKIKEFEIEAKRFLAFCKRVRKTENRNVDSFNQGAEYVYCQFLNLIEGEKSWQHGGKYFDLVDNQMKEINNAKNK